jgi:hypothetical protein
MTRVWLSLFCCEMYVVEVGSDLEAQAIRKGLLIVPPEDVDTVNNMTLHGRRRWGIARSASPDSEAPAHVHLP